MEERAIDRLRQFVLYLKQNKTITGTSQFEKTCGLSNENTFKIPGTEHHLALHRGRGHVGQDLDSKKRTDARNRECGETCQ